MKRGIVDVPGICVGHESNFEAKTGCTVILCEKGATTGVDVRGGAPGSRETDLLNPMNLVDKVHGIVLAGGSAFGLDAASGAMQYLEERNIGFDVGVTHVPIVPCSVLFDLTIGDPRIRPDKKMGYEACLKASRQDYQQGSIGAGTGATVGKIAGYERCMKSGIGTWSVKVGELVVGAIVAVNAFGDIVDPATGEIIAGARIEDGQGFINTVELMKQNPLVSKNAFVGNTTIGVVATNAVLTKAQAQKIAGMTHNGYARTIRPVHTQYDGDTVYVMGTGEVEADINVIGVLAAEVMEQAVLQAVKSANSL